MLRLYDYECPAGHRFEVTCTYEERPTSVGCSLHGTRAIYVISAPAVQTIDSHMRGTNKVDAHGGYFDNNLRDLKTGKYPYITSVAQKNKILRERGLVEVGSIPEDRERSRGRRIYSD